MNEGATTNESTAADVEIERLQALIRSQRNEIRRLENASANLLRDARGEQPNMVTVRSAPRDDLTPRERNLVLVSRKVRNNRPYMHLRSRAVALRDRLRSDD